MPRDDDAQRAIISEYLEKFTQEIQSKIKVQCMTVPVQRKPPMIEVRPIEDDQYLVNRVPQLDIS